MSSKTNTHIPLQLHKLFTNVTEACNKEERRQIVADLKERHHDPISLKDDGLLETFNDLYLSGKLTNNDLGILYITAQKSQNKDQIISCIDEFKRSQPFESQDFIGRSNEKQDLLELFSDQTTYGVNIHGVQGVGKTTLAKEIVKEFDQDSWETIAFDLREAKDIDTAYLFMLCTLGHSAFSNMNEMEDVRERARNTVLGHLQNKCSKNQKLLLLFDNIESDLIEYFKDELISFFDAIIDSEACKTGIIQIILTSKLVIPFVSIRNYSLEALPSSTSKDLICRRSKIDLQSEVLKDDEQEALTKVAEFCRNIPYLLEGAENMLRNGFITPHELLQKIEAQINQGVPVEYVTIKTLFDSIPTDSLKKLATKLCVFPKPFSLAEAKEIAELKSNYDALLDLEYLTNHGVISKVVTEVKTDDGKAESKAEYDVHSLFKDFAASFLRVQFPVYQESYSEAEIKFGNYFSDRLLNKLTSADDKHVHVIQHDEESFDAVPRLNLLNLPRLLGKLIHIPQHETICRITMLLNSLHIGEERTTNMLLKAWADVLENQGDLISSERVKCLEIICLADKKVIEQTLLDKATKSLDHVEEHINKISEKVLSCREKKEIDNLKCLFHLCKGKLDFIKFLFKEAIGHFKEALHLNPSTDLNENYLAVKLHESLSDCHMFFDYENSIESLKRALACAKLFGDIDKYLLVSLYNKLALAYGKTKTNQTDANLYLNKALDVQKELDGTDYGNPGNTALIYRNIGCVYMELKQYPEARTYFKRALEIWKEMGDKESTVLAYRGLGDAYYRQEEYPNAKSFYEEAIQMNKKLGLDDSLSMLILYKKLANIFISLKNYDDALDSINSAHEVGRKAFSNHPETVRTLNVMGDINAQTGDYDAALLNYEEAFKMVGSLTIGVHNNEVLNICAKLTKMCERCKEISKLQELQPRIRRLEQR